MQGTHTLKNAAWTTVLVAGLCLGSMLGAAQEAQAQGLDLQALLADSIVRYEEGRPIAALSMNEVLTMALERNTVLESVRLGETMAESRLLAAEKARNPTLVSSATASRTPVAFGYASSGLTVGHTSSVTLATTYTKPLDSGMAYSLSYAEANVSSSSSSYWSSSVTGGLNIPIYQDWGEDYHTIKARISRQGLSSSRLVTRQRELALLEQVALVYWALAGAQESVRVQRDAVALSEQLLKDNQARLEAGVLSPFDVQSSRTQLARERETLLATRAEVLRVEDVARAVLNLESIDVGFEPKEQPTVREVPSDISPLLEKVYARNTDLAQLRTRLATNALDTESAQNLEQPNLDLDLKYTIVGYGDQMLTGLATTSGKSLEGFGATLTWTMPLYDESTRQTLRQRRLERQQIILEEEARKSDLSVNLQSIVRQMRLAAETVRTAAEVVALEEEGLRNEIERFRVGEGTSFLVAQAQQELSAARQREIQARISFERNRIGLLALTGDIYEEYGLTPSSPEPDQPSANQ